MDIHTPLQSPPLSASSTANRRSRAHLFLPLTAHGMPKVPNPLLSPSSVRSHRFDGPLRSPSLTPMSPGSPQMSPPMSARSFGTFIESAPSTPAYSPRPESNWDGSTLVLLSPERTPPEPEEPEWEMLTPARSSKKRAKALSIVKRNHYSALTSPVIPETEEHFQKGNVPSITSEKEADPETEEETKKEAQPGKDAPFGKLASRMKSILRKRSDQSDRKKLERRRAREDLDRMEDCHWTEM